MRIYFLLCLLFCFSSLFSQQVSGIVTDENQNPVPAVLVINMATDEKMTTNLNGEFSLNASLNNELRFVRKGFERSSKVIVQLDFSASLNVLLIRVAQEIEEVEVSSLKLTGDLNKDSRNLTKIDRAAQVEQAVGVPGPPEKPRETPPPTVEQAGVIGFALSNLNLNTLYKNISGDAKRMRRLYKYDDLQDNINWIRERVDEDYFTKMGIPKEKISEFLQFSIGTKPEIYQGIKAKNLSKVLFGLEETLPQYLKNK